MYPGYRAWKLVTESYSEVLIHRVPLIPRATGGMRLALNYLSFIFSGLLFAPWALRKREFEVILVYAPSPLLQTLPAIFLSWLRRKPIALWVQDLWPQSLSATGYVSNKPILWLTERLVHFIYLRSKLLLVQSEAFIPIVRSLAPSSEIAYLPNSVNDSFAAEETGMPRASIFFTVLFAGNIGTAQAVDSILIAAEQLRSFPDIRFSLVGDGSRRQWLLDEVARRKLVNVEMPGRLPEESMPPMMRQASALLVTLAAQEIFEYTVPSKVQAYMAAGRPIVAALNGEGARIIREAGAGITVPAEDGQALARAILHLRNMPEAELDALGAAGRAYYKRHFREDMLVSRLIDHLDRILSEGKENK